MNSPEDNKFVPLPVNSVDRNPQESFQVLVVPQPQNARSMRDVASSTNGSIHAASAICSQPRVSLQKDGDKIIGIRIHCSCGQQIDLACSYQ